MGNSANRDPVDQEINEDLDQSRKQDLGRFKTLLLGTGDSGKSTIFKQMVRLHGENLSKQTLDGCRLSIWRNLIDGMTALIHLSRELEDEKFDNCHIADENQEAAEYVLSLGQLDESADLATIGKHVANLWADRAIQEAFQKRNSRIRVGLFDNYVYFADRTEMMFSMDYEVNEEDAFRVRAPTTGMTERVFDLNSPHELIFVDVGGQRSERRKWIRWFDDVDCILFVVAVSEFNQVLFEDGHTNRHQEAIETWIDIVGRPEFLSCRFILFLNKSDLFRDKISELSLSEFVEDYEGADHSYEDGMDYFTEKFLALAGGKRDDISVHATTATDSDLMQVILADVKAAILEDVMAAQGL